MSKSLIPTKEKPYRAVFKRPAGGWQVQYVTTHPGEILREEFLVPLNLTANALAIRLRIAAPRLHAILHEKRAVTPDTAMRLARRFGTSAQFWLNIQRPMTSAKPVCKMELVLRVRSSRCQGRIGPKLLEFQAYS